MVTLYWDISREVSGLNLIALLVIYCHCKVNRLLSVSSKDVISEESHVSVALNIVVVYSCHCVVTNSVVVVSKTTLSNILVQFCILILVALLFVCTANLTSYSIECCRVVCIVSNLD